jgi:hypothetical protein
MIKRISIMAALLTPLIFVSCTAKIYVIDKHTSMEEEAAGEWPQFEKEILAKSQEQGPTPFQKTEINDRKRRLYNVLNGEETTQTEASAATPTSNK